MGLRNFIHPLPQDIHQFLLVEGLCAERGSYKDDRHSYLFLEVAQRVQPIHAGQADVEQEQVRPVTLRHGLGIFRIGSTVGAIAGLLQIEGHAPAHEGIVIYDQDMLLHKTLPSRRFRSVNKRKQSEYFKMNRII
jgi:hypothetical protein